jgi:hypothetical protein
MYLVRRIGVGRIAAWGPMFGPGVQVYPVKMYNLGITHPNLQTCATVLCTSDNILRKTMLYLPIGTREISQPNQNVTMYVRVRVPQ